MGWGDVAAGFLFCLSNEAKEALSSKFSQKALVANPKSAPPGGHRAA